MRAVTPPLHDIPRTSTLEELFQEHHQRIFRIAFRLTGSSSDAEDVLQTVFTRLLQRQPLPELQPSPGPYLNRAAVNAALDILRARQTRRRVPLEQVQNDLEQDSRMRPDRLQDEAELRSWLRNALSRLNPRGAEMFVLRFIEGYGNQEIADLLGTSGGSVAVTLHRVRSRLQKEIRNDLGGRL